MNNKRLFDRSRFLTIFVKDHAFRLSLSILSIIFLFSAFQLGLPIIKDNVTASFFPILVSIVMLCALLYPVMNSIRDRFKDVELDLDNDSIVMEESSKGYIGVSIGAIRVILLTVLYLLAFNTSGYFISTFIYVFLMLGIFSNYFFKKILEKITIAIIITMAGYFMFEILFQVRLPNFGGW